MSKILISSLGTGNKEDGEYKKATYKIDDRTYKTPFIADALNKHLDLDKIFLIGTKKSIWDEAYLAFGGKDIDYHDKLYEEKNRGDITKHSLSKLDKLLHPFLIDYGINDDEIWSNFEKFLEIADEIEDGDEVYLDVTHSFRSLSLMSFVMTQFASSISDKKFKICGVYYGMLEYSFENDGITPIVDIKILLEIGEWIKAIDAIKKYSDFDPLVNLLKNDTNIEKSVNNTFVNLNNTINIANMSAMKQFIQSAHKKINLIQSTSNPIVKLLAPEILKIVDELNYEKMSDFQFALAKWFHKNKNFALSYMALAEAIVTKTCELKNYDTSTEDGRKEAKRHIDAPWDKYYSATKRENGKSIRNEGSISDIRNNIAHQLGLNSNVDNDIKKLSKFIESFESYFHKI